MENNDVVKDNEPTLLSVEKLKADKDALEKRVATLEKQVNDMIKELASTSSVSSDNGTKPDAQDKKEKLQNKLEEAFKR